MAAPAHLIQLIAQRGGGVAIPAGNINWDVPFPRALDLAVRTGAHVLAGLPLEPIVLAEIARARGLDPATLGLDTLFLGGAALPPALQRRMARLWRARIIELYGSTETMLLGTSCPTGTLHLEPTLAYCEVLPADDHEGRLIVTTLGVEGSPLVRFDTGDVVRPSGACACGDPRPGLVVLGRAADALELGGRRLFPYELIDAAAGAADALGSSVFFIVALPDRLLVRIESHGGDEDRAASLEPRSRCARGGRARRARNAARRRHALAQPARQSPSC
jgi:phenylacetate-CoA ligase